MFWALWLMLAQVEGWGPQSTDLAHWLACFSAGSTWSRMRVSLTGQGPNLGFGHWKRAIQKHKKTMWRGASLPIIRRMLKRLRSHLCHLFHFGVLLASCCTLFQPGYAIFFWGLNLILSLGDWMCCEVEFRLPQMIPANARMQLKANAMSGCTIVLSGSRFRQWFYLLGFQQERI